MAIRLGRLLALCTRSGAHGTAQQLECAGEHALSLLRCLAATLDAPGRCMQQQQQWRQQSSSVSAAAAGLAAELKQSRQYASRARAAPPVALSALHDQDEAADSDMSASDDEDDDRQQQQQQALSAAAYRQKYQLRVESRDAPDPWQTFEQAALPPPLLRALLQHGFTAPSFIQAQAWPIATQGRDLIAISSTGSGKTAGFLVPAFMHIEQEQRRLREHQQQQGGGGGQQQPQRQQRGGWSRWNQPQSWGAAVQPPIALVMAPTRELAQQIQQEAERLGAPYRIRNAVLYGGAPRGPQARMLSRGPQLVIATPGRLLDFVNSGELDVGRVSMLVLDEADRMLDMGFEPQIRDVLSFMPGGQQAAPLPAGALAPPPRQTLFFSATWPREVQAIARQLCANDPVAVFAGNVQEKLVANRDVTQLVALLADPEDRLPALMDYLHEHLHGAEMGDAPSTTSGSNSSGSSSSFGSSSSSSSLSSFGGSRRGGAAGRRGQQQQQQFGVAEGDKVDETHRRVVVFASTKRDCDRLTWQLSSKGLRAAAVHGDKSQSERDGAIGAFRRGQLPVLVATDVAARGLDIPGVTAVVNYDFPTDHDMYVHRIGRTGRAGRKGESLTLLTPADAPVTPVLVDIMRGAGQTVPPELEAVAARVRKPAQNKHRYGSGGGGGRGGGSRGRWDRQRSAGGGSGGGESRGRWQQRRSGGGGGW